MESYQDSERYINNISPEPTMISLNCYKTPDVQSYAFSNHYMISQMYPTPPSDSDESTNNRMNEHMNGKQIKQGTPIINEYYDENWINRGSVCESSSSYLNMINSNEKLQHEHSKENPSIAPISNRFKRRSRTTYSKTQLDILEATFQKTHYPEIRMVDDLSEMLKLSTERISIWFQNRRARYKKARKLELNQEKQSNNSKPTIGYSPLFEQMMSTNNLPNFPWLRNENSALKSAYKTELNDPFISTTINVPINYMDSFKSNPSCLNQQEMRSKYSDYYPTLVNATENQVYYQQNSWHQRSHQFQNGFP